MQTIRISDPASGAAAVVAPQLGFNCLEFHATIGGQAVDVIDSPEDVLTGTHRPSSYGIPILFPFPNRIRDGRFHWGGTDYALPLPPGKPNAIHGFCLDRPWRVVERTENSVTGRFQLSVDDPDRLKCWPGDFFLDVRYRVIENRLECQFKISNPGDRPLPWGLGTHAYFRLPFGRHSSPGACSFSVPVREEWELDEYLPTGRRLPVENSHPLHRGVQFGTAVFDNVYTGWQSGGGTVRCGIVDAVAGVELTQVCDASFFREAVVFTPPGRNAVCLEPYTCVSDAINLNAQGLDTGLKRLGPGESVQTWTAIQFSRVLA